MHVSIQPQNVVNAKIYPGLTVKCPNFSRIGSDFRLFSIGFGKLIAAGK